MRKLAPMIIISSLALAGGAFAADNTGSPTVAPNTTNAQSNSYSDKSNAASGTNAPMTEEAKAKAEANYAKMKAKKMKKDGMSHDTTTHSTPSSAGTMGTSTSTAPTPIPSPAPSDASKVNSTTGSSGK